MSEKIVFMPGAYKPPHKGHFLLIKELLKDKLISKIYIIISPKPRGLEFAESIDDIKKIMQKYNIKIDSGNIRRNYNEIIKKCKIPCITAKQSYEVWKLYIDSLDKKKQQKINIMISSQPSPVIMSYIIANGLKKEEIILVKSDKNSNNKRFDIFDNLKKKGIKISYIVLESFKNNKNRVLSSTNMRYLILYGNKKEFSFFIPEKINVNKVWKLLK